MALSIIIAPQLPRNSKIQIEAPKQNQPQPSNKQTKAPHDPNALSEDNDKVKTEFFTRFSPNVVKNDFENKFGNSTTSTSLKKKEKGESDKKADEK